MPCMCKSVEPRSKVVRLTVSKVCSMHCDELLSQLQHCKRVVYNLRSSIIDRQIDIVPKETVVAETTSRYETQW